MDLAARFNLRSANKHNNKFMIRALWFAVIVHTIAWFYWHPIQRVSAPELPDWINITLVAGFEERVEPQPETQSKPVNIPEAKPVKKIKRKPVEKKQQEVVEDNRAIQHRQEKKAKPASASTFIKADSRPFALNNPKPVYPSAARRRGMQGVVLLEASVSDTGYVTAINIKHSSGFKVLDVAAMNSVRQWHFIPAQEDNRAVKSVVQVPVRFTLNK